MSSPVGRLLRRNISAGQLAGYCLSSLAGMAIIAVAVQLYLDIAAMRGGDDSFLTRDYVTISRRVEGLGSLTGEGAAPFTEAEVDDIAAQPWARRVGEFTPATFSVAAAADLGGRGLSTSLFLEAIPDDFFDVRPPGWGYDAARREVPVILSKDYLSLYNFGFAPTHGLPQLSEAMIGLVPLKLVVGSGPEREVYDARIAGFSSRLNTIAVPEDFVRDVNGRLGLDPAPRPSRLIVEVTSPGDPALAAYLDAHALETGGDKADSGRASGFLVLVATIVTAIGAVISLLSLFILLLSLWLLLAKSRDRLSSLMLLGYTPRQSGRYYARLVVAVSLLSFAGAAAVMLCARAAWSAPLHAIGATEGASIIPALASIGAITLITAAAALAAIRRATLRYFLHP